MAQIAARVLNYCDMLMLTIIFLGLCVNTAGCSLLCCINKIPSAIEAVCTI